MNERTDGAAALKFDFSGTPVAITLDRQCVCAQSDMCRTSVTSDVCDQTCWDLINCVASNCPDFVAMAGKMDYSCLTANCSAFLAGVHCSDSGRGMLPGVPHRLHAGGGRQAPRRRSVR